jgi:hypothetical protein
MGRFRFGGNEFINCSVPLTFTGRYFIVEPGDPEPMISVIFEHQGKPEFEIFRNEPVENPWSKVTKTPPGIVTVVDQTDRFLYKVRPGSETSIVFGTVKGEETSAVITDRRIKIGSIVVENNVFDGVGAGVVVDENGNIGIGAPIPPKLLQLIKLL